MRLPIAPVLAALAAAATPAAASPWAVPPAGYRFEAPAVCAADPGRAGKPTRPGDAAYDVCTDQMATFVRGLAEAKASGRLLLVSFGATWCPWCATLQRHMAGPELLRGRSGSSGGGDGRDGRDGRDLAGALHVIEIALSTLDKGRKEAVPSGEQVLALVLRQAPGVRQRTIPFLAVVDPADASRVVARNLDDVATRSGDFDLARVRAVLGDAHDAMLEGRPAAPEPGWLRRKWQRLWSG